MKRKQSKSALPAEPAHDRQASTMPLGAQVGFAEAMRRQILATVLLGRCTKKLAEVHECRKRKNMCSTMWGVRNYMDGDLSESAKAMGEVAVQLEEGFSELAENGTLSRGGSERILRCPPPEEFLLPLRGVAAGEPCLSRLCPWCYGRQVVQGLDELGVLAALGSKEKVAFFHSKLGFNGELDHSFKHPLMAFVQNDVRECNPAGRFLFRVSIHPTNDSQFSRELVIGAVTSILPGEMASATGPRGQKPHHVSHEVVSCDDVERFCRSLMESFSFPTHALCPWTFKTDGPTEFVRLVNTMGRMDGVKVCDSETDSFREGTLIIPWWRLMKETA